MNSQQLWSKLCWQFVVMIILCTPVLARASDYPLEDDVSSIDGVIKAYYGVVSGPAGFEYDHERDRSLHAPDAIITRFKDDGAFERQTLAVATQAVDPWQEGFYEVEINRIVEQFGDLAHVWSTFETRNSADGKALNRGVSRVSLYYRNDRWWIACWSSQNETDEMLPSRYAPESEIR